MGQKILIADDDPVILKLLEVNLEMEGYVVISAQDGQDAVEKATNERPDLVILDIMMPRMDGWTAREEMLKVPGLQSIPVIFLSARAQQADIRRGYGVGVSEYVTKPFDPIALLEVVEKILAGTYRRPDRPRET